MIHSKIDTFSPHGSGLALDELGPEANALVQAGRAAFGPTPADSARILAALSAHVSLTSVGQAPAPVAAPVAAKAGVGWQAISMLVVGLGVTGGVAYLGVRGQPKPAPALAHAPTASAMHAQPGTAPTPPPAFAAAAATSASAKDVQPATTRRSDRLAAEVSILSRAETELHAGRFTSALKLLDEHARSFPRGTLTQERIAARVHALCGLGRVSEANTELARLAPGSLQEPGARDACSKR